MPQRLSKDQEIHLLGDQERLSDDFSPTQGGSDTTTCTRTSRPKGDKPRTVGTSGRSTNPQSADSTPEYSGIGQDGLELDDMNADGRPPYHRPNEGRSGLPLLSKNEDDVERGHASYSPSYDGEYRRSRDMSPRRSGSIGERPILSRRSTMRSRSPRQVAAENSTKKKYTYAAFFLGVSLISFCVQTELSAYIQGDLGWDKAYCMMYFTHGSWIVLWPIQLFILRMQKRDMPWSVFWKNHLKLLKTTAIMIETQSLDAQRAAHRSQPLKYMIRYTAMITCALTVAGVSWYVAVSLTTPSDLTAIYNCSAFFAYVFSVPLLREPLRLDKSIAVLVAIVGVLIIAYGDSSDSNDGGDTTEQVEAAGRFFGNMVIGVGSILYGLYEVLYKRFACPPEGVSPQRGMIFANTFGSCIGLFTLTVLWIPLPLLHWLGIEKFELPGGSTALLVLAAVLANATFSGSFLVLISLTSPVLSSVAALLTIFIVAIVDWFIKRKPLSAAAMLGGVMIIVAFLGLTLSTYREMKEHEAQKLAVDYSDSDKDGYLSDED